MKICSTIDLAVVFTLSSFCIWLITTCSKVDIEGAFETQFLNLINNQDNNRTINTPKTPVLCLLFLYVSVVDTVRYSLVSKDLKTNSQTEDLCCMKNS